MKSRQLMVLFVFFAIIISSAFFEQRLTFAQNSTPVPLVKIQIITANVDIHSGPGPTYSVIGTIFKSGKVILSGISSDGMWLMFKYANGQGWIPSDLSISEFITGNKGDLLIVEYTPAPQATSTLTPIPIMRATIVALKGKRSCQQNSMAHSLLIIASDLENFPEKLSAGDIDGALAITETAETNFFKTQDISDCVPTNVFCEGTTAGRPGCYFELDALVRSSLVEQLIATLYLKLGQVKLAQIHTKNSNDIAAKWGNLIKQLQDNVNYQGFDLKCTSSSVKIIIDGVKTAYDALDSEFNLQINDANYDSVSQSVELAKGKWLQISDLQNCSPAIVKLSALTEDMFDENLIAALYLNAGSKAMASLHNQRGLKLAQYINGLLSTS